MRPRSKRAKRVCSARRSTISALICIVVLMASGLPETLAASDRPPARAFCSEMLDGRTRIVACRQAGRIRVDVHQKRTDEEDGEEWRHAMVWTIDSEANEMMLYDLARQQTAENPLRRTLENLRRDPDQLQQVIHSKRQRDERLAHTQARQGRAKKNGVVATGCIWYAVEGPTPENEAGLDQYENTCVARFDDEIVSAYFDLLALVEAIDRQRDPLELSGLPLMNWRLPLKNRGGWIEPEHLPKIYVTGSKDPEFSHSRRMDFRYFFQQMDSEALSYRPGWE